MNNWGPGCKGMETNEDIYLKVKSPFAVISQKKNLCWKKEIITRFYCQYLGNLEAINNLRVQVNISNQNRYYEFKANKVQQLEHERKKLKEIQ